MNDLKPGDQVYVFKVPYMYTLENILFIATFRGKVRVGILDCAEIELEDGSRRAVSFEQIKLYQLHAT